MALKKNSKEPKETIITPEDITKYSSLPTKYIEDDHRMKFMEQPFVTCIDRAPAKIKMNLRK